MARGLIIAALILSIPVGHADEGKNGNKPALKSDDVEELGKALYKPNYRTHLEARERLAQLAKSSEGKQAAKAAAILREFEARGRKWLLSVGVKEDKLDFPFVSLEISEKTSADRFAYLYLLKGPTTLFVQGKNVTDAHVSYLSGMTRLRILDICDTSITGEAFERMDLPWLAVLRVNDCPVTDEAICKVSFPKLEVLNLYNTPVTNKLLAEPRMTKLRQLSVQGTRIDSGGLALLGGFRKLEGLGVDYDDLTHEVVGVIAAHPALKFIRLHCREKERKAAEAIKEKLPRCQIRIVVQPEDTKQRW